MSEDKSKGTEGVAGGDKQSQAAERRPCGDFSSGLGGAAITSQSRMGGKEEYTIGSPPGAQEHKELLLSTLGVCLPEISGLLELQN